MYGTDNPANNLADNPVDNLSDTDNQDLPVMSKSILYVDDDTEVAQDKNHANLIGKIWSRLFSQLGSWQWACMFRCQN